VPFERGFQNVFTPLAARNWTCPFFPKARTLEEPRQKKSVILSERGKSSLSPKELIPSESKDLLVSPAYARRRRRAFPSEAAHTGPPQAWSCSRHQCRRRNSTGPSTPARPTAALKPPATLASAQDDGVWKRCLSPLIPFNRRRPTSARYSKRGRPSRETMSWSGA
jgi:hypothetical protein